MASLQVTFLVILCSSVLPVEECTCPSGFLHFQDSCYWFSNIQANVADARSYCGFLKSHLVVINNNDENEFVRNIARNRTGRHFLGATDLGEEGSWVWEGGRKVKDAKWGDKQPDNDLGIHAGGEDCLDLWPSVDYMWNDAVCSLKQKFICERCYH